MRNLNLLILFPSSDKVGLKIVSGCGIIKIAEALTNKELRDFEIVKK
jgi:hypothetical protein